jgi:alkylation response protein AidB-like acyl-CoA dehydrogenase
MPSLISPISTAAIVKRIEPVLKAYRDQSETDRKLAPPLAAAMVDTNVFQSLVPAAYGGLELSPIDAFQLYEEIARIYGSAGWLAANQSGIATLVSLLPAEAADEIFADGRVLFAGALFPPGAAIPVEGGYRVSGRWPFASGSNYANWMVASAFIIEDGQPRMGPHGEPMLMAVVFRQAEATVIENWDTLGMRGTGSNDFAVSDVFVPAHRTWIAAPGAMPTGAFSAPIYRLGFWPVSVVNATVAIGVARAALDDLLALASKTPAYVMTSVGDKQVVQDRVARARATLDAARSYIYVATQDAVDSVSGGGLLDPTVGISLALSGTFAMEAAREVVDAVHSMAGSSAIRNGMRFEAYFRDVHTLTQHAYSSASRYESIGKLLLGKETDWAFFAL